MSWNRNNFLRKFKRKNKKEQKDYDYDIETILKNIYPFSTLHYYENTMTQEDINKLYDMIDHWTP